MAQATQAVIITGGGPDNSLPGVPPGIWGGAPPFVDNALPPPPPGIWPPPVGLWPPVQVPPDYPMPPGSIWPPVHPVDPGYGQGHPLPPHAGQPLPPGGERPDQGLPGEGSPPDRPEQGLPPHAGQPLPPAHGRPDQGLPSQKFLVAIVAASAAGGLKVVGYTVVDPSLSVGLPLPPAHGRPDQGLPWAPARPDQGLPPTEPTPRR